MNLVSNAVEAMPDGGRVTISIANASLPAPLPGFQQWRPGSYLRLSVADTGIGIHVTDIHRIFEPFYTKKVMGRSGTGLGMAVVWGTIEDHKGHITVRSQEGQGTVFEVFLPVDVAAEPPKPARTPRPLAMGAAQTILVVDDSADQREFAAAILKRLGYRPESVESGEAAVAFLRERTVDLVIIDMLMPPGMDGLDTYREIIRIHPGQKAIIASGFSESTRVREARKLGVSSYVRKPYTLSEISDALQSALTA
jgi:CheY-like chemotaxis protein